MCVDFVLASAPRRKEQLNEWMLPVHQLTYYNTELASFGHGAVCSYFDRPVFPES